MWGYIHMHICLLFNKSTFKNASIVKKLYHRVWKTPVWWKAKPFIGNTGHGHWQEKSFHCFDRAFCYLFDSFYILLLSVYKLSVGNRWFQSTMIIQQRRLCALLVLQFYCEWLNSNTTAANFLDGYACDKWCCVIPPWTRSKVLPTELQLL